MPQQKNPEDPRVFRLPPGSAGKGETVEIPDAGAKCYGRRQKRANFGGLPMLGGSSSARRSVSGWFDGQAVDELVHVFPGFLKHLIADRIVAMLDDQATQQVVEYRALDA
jgi:hypothetical protein